MQVIWRSIFGYEGLYEVSDHGEIRSLTHSVKQLNRYGDKIVRRYIGRMLKPRCAKNGYLYVNLSKNGVRKTVKNHRMVAETFVPEIDEKPQVNHKDGCKQNNQASNLEWVTCSENHDHAMETGLSKPCPFGTDSHNYKGEVLVYNESGGLVDRLFGHTDITSKGYSSCGVSSVITGRQKTHRGMYFERAG